MGVQRDQIQIGSWQSDDADNREIEAPPLQLLNLLITFIYRTPKILKMLIFIIIIIIMPPLLASHSYFPFTHLCDPSPPSGWLAEKHTFVVVVGRRRLEGIMNFEKKANLCTNWRRMRSKGTRERYTNTAEYCYNDVRCKCRRIDLGSGRGRVPGRRCGADRKVELEWRRWWKRRSGDGRAGPTDSPSPMSSWNDKIQVQGAGKTNSHVQWTRWRAGESSIW